MNWTELTNSYKIWDEHQIKGFFGKGEDGYRFLSNFEPARTRFEDYIYATSEAAYMASKTDKDSERRALISIIDPTEAKKYGQTVTLRPDWDKIKFDMMLVVVFDKFSRNPELRKRLLATGDRYLEETNHWNDLYYGVDYKSRVGKNALGQILMKVRKCLNNRIIELNNPHFRQFTT